MNFNIFLEMNSLVLETQRLDYASNTRRAVQHRRAAASFSPSVKN